MKCKRRFMHGKRRKRSPIKNETMLDVAPIDPTTKNLIAGAPPSTGGLGLALESAKTVFEGYGTTNPQIIKDARMMPGKI